MSRTVIEALPLWHGKDSTGSVLGVRLHKIAKEELTVILLHPTVVARKSERDKTVFVSVGRPALRGWIMDTTTMPQLGFF